MADLDPDVMADLARYLDIRDRHRADHAQQALDAMTERERQLFTEAAVMGYVQGLRYAGRFDWVEHPKPIDRWIVSHCQSMPELYPTIAALTGGTND